MKVFRQWMTPACLCCVGVLCLCSLQYWLLVSVSAVRDWIINVHFFSTSVINMLSSIIIIIVLALLFQHLRRRIKSSGLSEEVKDVLVWSLCSMELGCISLEQGALLEVMNSCNILSFLIKLFRSLASSSGLCLWCLWSPGTSHLSMVCLPMLWSTLLRGQVSVWREFPPC